MTAAQNLRPPTAEEKRSLCLIDGARGRESADLVAKYMAAGAAPQRFLAVLGTMLLREDRDFHTIQTVEAAFRQYELLAGTPEATHVLIAAARYLAAHAPTVRAQEQTYQIARRLHRGERIFEEESDGVKEAG